MIDDSKKWHLSPYGRILFIWEHWNINLIFWIYFKDVINFGDNEKTVLFVEPTNEGKAFCLGALSDAYHVLIPKACAAKFGFDASEVYVLYLFEPGFVQHVYVNSDFPEYYVLQVSSFHQIIFRFKVVHPQKLDLRQK